MGLLRIISRHLHQAAAAAAAAVGAAAVGEPAVIAGCPGGAQQRPGGSSTGRPAWVLAARANRAEVCRPQPGCAAHQTSVSVSSWARGTTVLTSPMARACCASYRRARNHISRARFCPIRRTICGARAHTGGLMVCRCAGGRQLESRSRQALEQHQRWRLAVINATAGPHNTPSALPCILLSCPAPSPPST